MQIWRTLTGENENVQPHFIPHWTRSRETSEPRPWSCGKLFSPGPALPWLLHSLGYIRGTARERPAARDAQGGQGKGGGERERARERKRERVAKVKVRNRTRGESDKKGTKEAAGCDRKINTYNVQNSQALFVSEERLLWPHTAACRWTFSEKRAPDKWSHLEDGYLFYCTYVCLVFIKWLWF